MNKVALVTGASRGIGAETARVLARDGFSLALVYNNSSESALNLAQEISQGNDEILIKLYKCDIKSSECVNNTVKNVIADFGRIDVLVNNAGVAQQKLFIDITDNDWNEMISTNLSGAFYFTRAVVTEMIKRKSGKIINVSSMWGETGGSCEVHYSAAKAGIIGMTKALAKEVGLSGITVNAVSPGVVMTDMMSHFSDEDIEELKQEIPLNRLGSVTDIANAISFLAGEKSDYITGQVMSVNGGIVI